MAQSLTFKAAILGLSKVFPRPYYNVETLCRRYSENQTEDSNKEIVDPVTADEDPEEPTTCCMSGCANCVWIAYAEVMAARYKDGGTKARKALENIQDPNMRAFLMTELKSIGNK